MVKKNHSLSIICAFSAVSVFSALAFPVPTGVIASWGTASDRIHIQWDSAGDGAFYRVYRWDADLEMQVGVSAWLSQTEYEHVEPSAAKGKMYQYQVRSATSSAGASPSGYSTPFAIGFIGFQLSQYSEASLTITAGGDSLWVGQYAEDGIAQQLISGQIGDSQETWVEAEVAGPGTITFDWKKDSQLIWDKAEFRINGVLTGNALTANSDWMSRSHDVAEIGPTTLRWRYVKNATTSEGLDCAWLRNIVWTAAAGQGVSAPADVTASDGAYLDYVRITWEPVSAATHYQILRSASPDGAKTVVTAWAEGLVFDDWGVNPGDTYYYFVRAAVDAGGTQGSPYSEPDPGWAAVRPANDAFANAQAFFGVYGGSTSGDCSWAAPQAGEPVHAGDMSATNSVWWSWVAPVNGPLRVESRGSVSNFIPVLAAYTNAGTTVGMLVTITNGVPGTNGWTTASFEAAAGATYWLAVAGRDGVGSPLELRWAVDGWLCPAPSNVSATDESLFERVRVTWDAVPEATHYEVWRVEAGVRPGTPWTRISDWAAVTFYDDTSANPGVAFAYYVRAATDATGWLAGPFGGPDTGTAGSRPWNDNLVSAGVATGMAGTVWSDNALATAEFDEPGHAGTDDAVNSVWWRWVAPSNAVYRFTTEGSGDGYDHVLAVYTNAAESGVGALAPVAAAVRGEAAYAAVFVAAEAGVSYFIAVAGRDGLGGVVAVRWNPRLPPPANVCATDATELWLTRITWDAVSGATLYEVSRATSADGEKTALSGWTAELSYDDWGGDLGVSYLYFVRAADAALQRVSDYSQPDAGTAAGRPANDNRSDAAPLTAAEGVVAANSLFATREPGEPQHAGFSDAGASLWWTWTAPVSAPVTVTTSGDEAFAAVLAVYTNAAGGSLAPVAGFYSNGFATVTFDARAGKDYLIALAGRPNAGGPVTVAWAYGDWAFPAPDEVLATDGTRLGEILVTWSTVADAGVYEVSRADTADGVGRAVVCLWAEPTAFVDTEAIPGQIYYYFVRAALDTDGVFAGAIGGPAAGRAASRPANDDRADAALIGEGVFLVASDVTWASAEADEPAHGDAGSGATNSVWWVWIAPQDGIASFDAGASGCPAPVVALYTNAPGGGLAPVSGVYSNGYAALVCDVRGGAEYQLAVAGFQGAGGAVTLSLTFEPAGPDEPPPAPLITRFDQVTVENVRIGRLRFEAIQGVAYEVLIAPGLSPEMVWVPLVPPVAGVADADEEMVLEVPLTAPSAFFKIEAKHEP